MALSSPVLCHDSVCVCVDECQWIWNGGTFDGGSVVYASVMDCHPQRGDDAAAVSLLVLAVGQRRKRFFPVDGIFQSVNILCGVISDKKPFAGLCIPDRVYERSDERKHDTLVYDHARVERLQASRRKNA